jgi:hypothetical protein
MKFSIQGHDVYLYELEEDVKAAIAKGLSGKFAFTPETVEALCEKIRELTAIK